MTPSQICDFFYTLIDDEPDIDAVYNLMDTAYTIVNGERSWNFLLKLDTSLSHLPSDSWQTEKTLPSDFAEPYKLFGGDSDNEYWPVPFDMILANFNVGNRYAIDMLNLKMRLLGSVSSALTMYLWYLYFPTSLFGLSDAQKISSSTIVWPIRFRKVLAYKMAEIYLGGVDADEITRQLSPAHRVAYTELKKTMIKWDDSIKLRMMGTSASHQRVGNGERSDVVTWPIN